MGIEVDRIYGLALFMPGDEKRCRLHSGVPLSVCSFVAGLSLLLCVCGPVGLRMLFKPAIRRSFCFVVLRKLLDMPVGSSDWVRSGTGCSCVQVLGIRILRRQCRILARYQACTMVKQRETAVDAGTQDVVDMQPGLYAELGLA